MTAEYEIVKYSPEFRDQVIEIQKYLWGPESKINSAYFDWKYERNPYVKDPLLHLALHDGKVVGMRGLFGSRWQIGEPAYIWNGLCAGDTVVTPEYRKRGLVLEIVKTAAKYAADLGHDYLFNLTNSQAIYAASTKMGWREIGKLQALCLRNPAALQLQLPDHISFATSPRPEAMAELVERAGPNWRLRHVRDQTYFAWRFQNPRSHYGFVFWEGARLEGYLVLQRSIQNANGVANIVDWEATGEDIESDLIDAVVAHGDADELVMWSAALPDRMRSVLQRKGFSLWVDPQRAAVLVSPTRNGMRDEEWRIAGYDLLDSRNWDLRMIYSDGA